MARTSKLALGMLLALCSSSANAAEAPAIAAGAEYSRASADLTRARYKPMRHTGERAGCASQKALCEAFPEIRECTGQGDASVCLFQWTSADGRTSAYVEAKGNAPKTLRVTRAYIVLTGGNPYPLGTSGM